MNHSFGHFDLGLYLTIDRAVLVTMPLIFMSCSV